MNIVNKILLLGLCVLSQIALAEPKQTMRLCVKNKKMSCGVQYFMRPIYTDGQYYNVLDDDSCNDWEPTRVMRDSIALLSYRKIWGNTFDAAAVKGWYKPSLPIRMSVEPAITWIGQSTMLIQYKNINIITDPVFGDLSWLSKRSMQVGLSPNRLPHIDVILLSHNHTDHMDEESLMRLRSDQPFVMVPQGNAQWFKEHGFNYVTEYTWWERQEIVLKSNSSTPIIITCVPAIHSSGRSAMDTNETLWCGWVISCASEALYFAGDTAYNKRLFDEIHALFPSIRVALLPIGPIEPAKLLNATHMNPEQAVEAFIDLEAQWFIPIHWGTFRFGTDTFMVPIDRLKKAWADNKLDTNNLQILKCGQRIVYQAAD
jgi:L-ascorbate metabolism protein UlaG (beta-lactamase superfamily)